MYRSVMSGARVAVLMLAFAGAAVGQTAPVPRAISIRTGDGLTLAGTLFASPRPGPAVLLLHQCDQQRKVWDALGSRLTARGITALSMDYRGYGESEGTPPSRLTPAALATAQAQDWPRDIDSALAFLVRQPGVDATRIAAGGGSCGVGLATQLSLRHRSVKALVLLAGTTDRAGRRSFLTRGALPIFTAAAADDESGDFVTIMGWYAALSNNARSRMAQYRDGGHAAMIFARHPGLADTIATWLSAVLTPGRTSVPKTNGVPMRSDVARVLQEIDQPGGALAVGVRLATARARDSSAALFPEVFVNLLGYEHLASKDLAGAFEIMRLNVQGYPASPNAMDSLGDIYLARGDTAAALGAARKTLALLEKDTVDSKARKAGIRDAAEGKIRELSRSTP